MLGEERMSGVEARFRAPICFRTLGESFLIEDHVSPTCKTKGWDKRMVSSFLTDGSLLSLRGSRRPAGQLTGRCPGVAGNTRFGDSYWVGRGANTCFQGQAAAGSTQKGRKKEGRGWPPCARPAPGAPLPAPGAAQPSPASPAGGSHAPLAGRLPRPVRRAAVPGAPALRRRPRPPPARRSRPRGPCLGSWAERAWPAGGPPRCRWPSCFWGWLWPGMGPKAQPSRTPTTTCRRSGARSPTTRAQSRSRSRRRCPRGPRRRSRSRAHRSPGRLRRQPSPRKFPRGKSWLRRRLHQVSNSALGGPRGRPWPCASLRGGVLGLRGQLASQSVCLG